MAFDGIVTKKVVDELRDGVISQKDAYVALNAEIEKNIEAQKDQARFAAHQIFVCYFVNIF